MTPLESAKEKIKLVIRGIDLTKPGYPPAMYDGVIAKEEYTRAVFGHILDEEEILTVAAEIRRVQNVRRVLNAPLK